MNEKDFDSYYKCNVCNHTFGINQINIDETDNFCCPFCHTYDIVRNKTEE